ncbi:hypothetical protein ACHWQZ_G009981 [Mnemiopsis leidyi]
MSQSIVAAYQNKYEDEDEEQEVSEIKLVFVKRKKFKLCNLILDNCSITKTGSLDKVADICSKVTECDLSHNIISEWSEVFRLLDVGLHIKFLNLSSNKLGKCEQLPEKQYTSLQCLILCGNDNDWDNLHTLLPSFPSLTHLNIGYSNISALPSTTDTVFPNLTELNLIQNNISRFEDVLGLAHTFPNLHTLVLSDNPLSSFGEDQKAIERFEKLAKLHVNNITINSWEEVSKLRWFPELSDIRMIHWDLFGDMNESERRKMLGALLPNTHLINGSPIPNREAAERWYMRRCQAANDVENRRYKELYEKYGELPELGDIKLGGQDETITLKLCVPERGVEMEKTFSIYDSLKDIKTFVKNEYSIKKKLMIEVPIVEDAPVDLYGISFDYTLLHRTALKDGDTLTLRSENQQPSTEEILRRFEAQHNFTK